MKKAIFLDRDGVINELIPPYFNRGPRNVSELIISPNVFEVINFALNHGYICVIITNQPDVARGKMTVSENNALKQAVLASLPKGVYYLECLHDNEDDCVCRKPKIGMFIEAFESLGIDPNLSLFIGDKWTDVLAGKQALVNTVLLQNEFSWIKTSQGDSPTSLIPDYTISEIKELIQILNY